MVPKSVHVIDEMPVNGNGKVDRNALRCWLDDRAKNVTDQFSFNGGNDAQR